jgi:lipid-A-disaccharide synthase
MAKYAKKHGIRVFYYISPQLWAWRSSRVETVKKYVDRMFVILPFEQAFYARYNYEVDFRGHPLLDVINEEMPAMPEEEFLKSNMLTGKPLIALLPGSRKMEIAKMLRVMASIRPDFPDHQLVVGGAPSIAPAFYRDILSDTGVGFVTGQTRQLLKHAVAALVTSGTATLETALTAVPQIVCYRGNPISYLIARQLVHVKYISLVNLICDAPVVPELIQRELTRENLSATLQSILAPGERREAMLAGYRTLKERLGGQGASARVAGLMIQYLPKNQVNPLSKQEL